MSARKRFSRIAPLMRILLTLGLLLAAGAGQAIERVTYYHNDALGSPVAATDRNGTLLWRENYAPYGERLTHEASGKDTVWYTGKQEEAAFGLNYFGARWYDPKFGRFMGVDPAGFSSDNIQSFNRYAYANNNPYAYVDPNGQAAVAVVVPAVILVGSAIYVASGPEQQAQMGKLVTWMGQNVKKNLQWAGAIVGVLTGPYFNENTSGGVDEGSSKSNGNESGTGNNGDGASKHGDAGDSNTRGNSLNGEPGTWVEHPHGKQDRLYGSDGTPAVDIDYGHDHGQGSPHAHNWDKGTRGPGVPVTVLPKK
jgi:RHS repeat-associated protein